jgi:hypothetical protein
MFISHLLFPLLTLFMDYLKEPPPLILLLQLFSLSLFISSFSLILWNIFEQIYSGNSSGTEEPFLWLIINCWDVGIL